MQLLRLIPQLIVISCEINIKMEILEEISWFVRPISCPVLVILPSSPLSHSCLSLHSFCHLSHLGYRASKQALWKRTLTSTDSPNIPPTISPCYNPLIHNSQKTPRNLPETHYSKFITPRQENLPWLSIACRMNVIFSSLSHRPSMNWLY